MVMSPAGLGTKNDCAGEGQHQFAYLRLQRFNLISVTLYIIPSSIKIEGGAEPPGKHTSEFTDGT
jgi:hypothetical protein